MKNKIKKLKKELKEAEENLKLFIAFPLSIKMLKKEIIYLKYKINLYEFMDN